MMMATKTTIYVYGEHTTRKGTVAYGVEPDDDGNVTDDVFLYGEGTEEEIVAQALESLATPDARAPQFRHKCDRAVLEYLGGPKVEPHYDAEHGSYWLPSEIAGREDVD